MNVEDKRALLADVAQRHGTPSFVYFVDEVVRRVESLRYAFGGRFGVSYAVKSNPNPGLLAQLRDVVDTLDISSSGELALSLEAGWDPEKISFTGPGKRGFELQAAVRDGVGEVIVESLEEAVRLDAEVARAGKRQAVLVRIAPARVPKGFGDSMAGKPVAFGIDEEVLQEALLAFGGLAHLEIVGFHIYSGTQCLAADSLAENYRIFIDLFRRAVEVSGISPRKLVFGAGIGVPYHDGQQPVDLASVAEQVAPDLDALVAEAPFAETELLLEAGRYLVGEAGVLLTRVIHKKESRGTTICVCDAGLNNHLAAAGHFGMIMKRNYPMTKVWPLSSSAPSAKYNLVGPLCTSIDTIGRGVEFFGLEVDDVVAIHCSGAYGLTASPMFFISHPVPSEYLVLGDSDVIDVSRDFGGYGGH